MIRRGTYLLLLDLPCGAETDVGSLGRIRLEPGTYCYVGSAMGGLDQRLSRHLSRDKAMRWHIDRLTVMAASMRAYESQVPECALAAIVEGSGGVPAVPGFGCSDCHCGTHLFLIPEGVEDVAVASASAVPFTDRRQRPECRCASRTHQNTYNRLAYLHA